MAVQDNAEITKPLNNHLNIRVIVSPVTRNSNLSVTGSLYFCRRTFRSYLKIAERYKRFPAKSITLIGAIIPILLTGLCRPLRVHILAQGRESQVGIAKANGR